jgi:diketogulonate reductase-like aldo/keto reductase
VLEEALRAGYRMLDLSREDRNEQVAGDILHRFGADSDVPLRSEVFLVSKVWPTHLGFGPTSREVTKSLLALQSAYTDLYLIHWPV